MFEVAILFVSRAAMSGTAMFGTPMSRVVMSRDIMGTKCDRVGLCGYMMFSLLHTTMGPLVLWLCYNKYVIRKKVFCLIVCVAVFVMMVCVL